MKKIFNLFSVLALCLAFVLNGCVSENLIPNPYNAESRGLIIRFDDVATTRGTTAVGTTPAFNEGYLLVVSGSLISRVYEIHNTTARGTNPSGGYLYIADLRNTAIEVILPAVSGSTTRIIVVGNTTLSPVPVAGMPLSQIAGQPINVLTQHNRNNLNLWGESPRSTWNPPAGARTHYIATVEVLPTVARFEMRQIDACPDSQIASFRVAGIFIDNHYYDAHVGGFIPGAGVAPTLAPRTNFVSRGDGTTPGFLFQPGSFGYTDAATFRALFDAFTPATLSTGAGTSVSPFTVALTDPNRWAYHLFAMQSGTRMPNIVIRLSNVRLRGATVDLPGHPTSGFHYLTISQLIDNATNQPLTGIHAGNLYQIASLAFSEQYLSHYPNVNPFDANVRVTVAHWNEQETTFPGFTQPNPASINLGVAPQSHTFNLGAAVNGYSTSTVLYLWQWSHVGGNNPDDWNDIGIPSVANREHTATGLTQTTYFRRIAICGCTPARRITSALARVSVIP